MASFSLTRFVLSMACLGAAVFGTAMGGEPVALRIESLLVAPAHTPSVVVVVKNLSSAEYSGTVKLEPPSGWALEPAEQAISLAGGATGRVRFVVHRGAANEANAYAMTAIASGAGINVTRRQQISVASAPYSKPVIDGDTTDWQDAIPVAWTTGDQKTTVSTFWNRKSLAILVAVEEKQWTARSASGDGAFDAVQIAIAPAGTATGDSPDAICGRFEFLLTADASRRGRCFLLASPGMTLAETQRFGDLEPLARDDVELAVRRADDTTIYECAIPVQLLREHIRPSEGREFQLSLLVHDPDGTGVRDWGEAAGLWPWQRKRLAWSLWRGAQWGELPPLDSTTPWGMCSSKY